VTLGEVEECIMLQERVLEMIALDRRNGDVGRDPASTIDSAPTVGKFDFLVRVVAGLVLAIVIIVVKRDVAVVTLNQASAGRVVTRGGQRQPSVLRKRIDRLHQALAEGDLAYDQAAVVILNRSGNNLGG